MAPRARWLPLVFASLLALGLLAQDSLRGQAVFVRGEVNQDGRLDVSDAIGIIGHLFLGSPTALDCADAADLDDSGALDTTDAVRLVSFLFLAGAAPAAPFPSCGRDPSEGEGLDCRKYQACSSCGPTGLAVLCSLESEGTICPGEVITLAGINFSSRLEDHSVRFHSGPVVLHGAPLSVTFPSDGIAENGLESRLRVLAPSGLVSGTAELEVEGIPAGSRGYRACPQIVNFGIGPAAREAHLLYSSRDGFLPPLSVVLFGLNLETVVRVTLTDRFGSRVSIPSAEFLERAVPGLTENGLQSIQFSLRGLSGLAFQDSEALDRDHLLAKVETPTARSNGIQLPVLRDDYSGGLGAVVNGILVPPGVRTGPVRIRYSMYDHPEISQAFAVEVEWTADGRSWFPALPDSTDPLSDGTRVVLPGDLDFGPPAGLLFAGGALRTFTWDTQNDPNLREVVAAALREGKGPGFKLTFRIHPLPEMPVPNKPPDLGHFMESPPLAYLDLEPGGAAEASLREDFTSARLADPALTTASWGPPLNPGELRGTLPGGPVLRFGTGSVDLVLAATAPDSAKEYFVVDTDAVAISRLVELPEGRVETATVFPDLGVDNPGASAFEFHLRTLTVGPGTEVLLEGSRPAVFRISGAGRGDEDVSVRIDGLLMANGEPGTPGGDAPGAGGRGHAGGGDGGAGAALNLDASGHVAPSLAGKPGLVPAGQGGNGGGEGGNTSGAVDPTPSNVSRFLGAPGGGGGHRLAGGTGDAGLARTPVFFTPPRGGRGGPARGTARLDPLTAGSGGGGGGATIQRTIGSAPQPRPGAGGGGGGGAIQITARGSMAVSGKIEANGGSGGNGDFAGGAGGGGSGGSILLQSSGSIAATCENLEVEGGAAGITANQNLKPGAGRGSPGRIRLESRRGGALFCEILRAETVLVAPLDTSQAVSRGIQVQDTSGFPPQGVLRIDDELIGYRERDLVGQFFKGLTRGLRGTMVASHQAGGASPAQVFLEGATSPPDSLIDEGQGTLMPTSDPIAERAGADGMLHAHFIPSIDPDTGLPLTDPRTGGPVSLWQLSTVTGVVTDPSGAVVLVAAAAGSDAGLFSFDRLRIDPGVVLSATGSRPLRMEVAGDAEIGGVLDLSGSDGGALRFDRVRPEVPRPGLPGSAGPGGGPGGGGADLAFLDGNPDNKDPSNLREEPAARGGLPAGFPAQLDRTGATNGANPPPADLSPLETTRATPGESLLGDGGACGACSAGGGGGGGSRRSGADGLSLPAGSVRFGRGGSRLGLDGFRSDDRLLLLGGQGGAGGGASADVSADYQNCRAGHSLFMCRARFAPGTGGGGGGGVLHLAVGGALVLRSGGAILSLGGNAYQSIDRGGNGGAGGGGDLLLQVRGGLEIEEGARLDVSGGRADLAPPIPPGQTLPLYEGNLRVVGGDSRAFGGLGGEGAPGRVRIEAPTGSGLLARGYNPNVSSAIFEPQAFPSVGVSRVVALGVGPARAALSHLMIAGSPTLRFLGDLPPGTDGFLLFEGASASLDVHGRLTPLRGSVEDLSSLQDLEYVRFSVRLSSNLATGQVPSADDVVVPYRLDRVQGD